MDLNKNYYKILGLSKDASINDIKKAYYKLSFIHHPDKGGDVNTFNIIKEAYEVLTSENREIYDTRSKYGKNYNEYYELLNSKMIIERYEINHKYKKKIFKKNDSLNIYLEVDEDSDETIEYERWVKCKACDGTGRDTTSKIHIKDENGNIIKTFEGLDGCDFCEGTGKDNFNNTCKFCAGKGKVGLEKCKKCGGEKRILGIQRLSVFTPSKEKKEVYKSLGNYSKDEPGVYGDLIIIKK